MEVATAFDEPIKAPVSRNQALGKATLTIDGEKVAICDLVATQDVQRINIATMLGKVMKRWLCM